MDAAPVLAYFDGGSGALIWQYLIGGLLGSLFILKMFWRNLVTGVGRIFGKKPAETTDDKDGTQE
ncbi:MAG: hypothetical protein RBU25_18815 [Lentisphaeria bacterium]|jgi:hypothetical protein|nr:hypothetical protein [Lentisphaeria bacterium]